jgi:ribosome-associated toxin RatA of RatAB toxin-antitoxin module
MLSDRSDRIPALVAITVSARLVRLLPWLLLGWWLIGANSVRSDEGIKFEAVWEGEFVAVSANADLPVTAATAWSVLTDYDRFAEFIPDMVSSRIVSRSHDGMTVDYTGNFGFLFFRQPMHLVLNVVLDPPRRILARSVSGDLRDLTASYEISGIPPALHLTYKARFLPAVSLPPFIGLAVVRHQMEKQFAAMVKEIIRRGTLAEGKSRAEAER